MYAKELAILEFDENRVAKMTPADFSVTPKNLPERCVISFSSTSVEEIAKKHNARQISAIGCCTCILPIYGIDYEGETVALVAGIIGSAGIAGQIEELVCGGVRKIVACGSAGSLTPNPLGALVIPTVAVRDEGASFHYAQPSYEIEADGSVAEQIGATLADMGIPFVFGKTWTTDAFYRETEGKIALRRAQDCITVEMECSAMIAVCRFLGVQFGQILYCGDDLSGENYDSRNFADAKEVRRNLTEFALKCALSL